MLVKVLTHEHKDVEKCYALRKIIFVQGQQVPIELEKDEKDSISTHFLLLDDYSEPIGVGRIYSENKNAIVGRLGIVENNRKNGSGLFLMQTIIDHCKEQDFENIILGAQEHAIGFYEKLGFDTISERYMDANIPHFKMQLKLN